MLWVNLIMDTFAALALATEPPNDELLNEKPYNKNDSIMTAVMFRNICGQAIYQIIVLIALLFFGVQLFGLTEYNGYSCSIDAFYMTNQGEMIPTCKTLHYTMVFNTFVFMQVFNQINARKLGDREFNVFSRFFNNWLFLLIMIIIIAVQVLMVQYGGKPLRCVPLTPVQHGYCIAVGAFSLFIGKEWIFLN